jgi:short-subunit dehydrogenase
MLRLHVLAPMRLTRAALPGMMARRRGAIINVSSVAGFIYSPGNVNYCASKAYLTTFTEGLALELAGTGVAAQALCPGFTHTEFHQRMGPDARTRPRFMWLTAEGVVRASLAQLDRGGPVLCVPGLRYKLIVAALRLLPRRAIGALTGRRRSGTA